MLMDTSYAKQKEEADYLACKNKLKDWGISSPQEIELNCGHVDFAYAEKLARKEAKKIGYSDNDYMKLQKNEIAYYNINSCTNTLPLTPVENILKVVKKLPNNKNDFLANYETKQITGDGLCWMRSLLTSTFQQLNSEDQLFNQFILKLEGLKNKAHYPNGSKNMLFTKNEIEDAIQIIKSKRGNSVDKNVDYLNRLEKNNFLFNFFRKIIAYENIQDSWREIQLIKNRNIKGKRIHDFNEEIESIIKLVVEGKTMENWGETVSQGNLHWGANNSFQGIAHFFGLQYVSYSQEDDKFYSISGKEIKAIDYKQIHSPILLKAVPGHYEVFVRKE
jgi:hypothetical protein